MSVLADLLDTPTYSPSIAARLARVNAGRVRRWLRGYEYDYTAPSSGIVERRTSPPLVHRRGAADSPHASFLDLVDLLFVKEFLDYGVSLKKLRLALAEAQRLLGGHHFAHERFWTDGRNVYLEIGDRADALLELAAGGQWAIARVIKAVGRQIEFDRKSGYAERWFPLGPRGHVVLDPRVAFGAPSIVAHGVETANVYDLFKAEQRRATVVADWMAIPPEAVKAAVEFEESRALAA